MTATERAFKPGGRVRTGQLYRSTELNHLHGEDLEQFARFGISAVFDMRTAAAPAQLLKVLADPKLAEQMLGEGKAVQIFERGYREIVSLPSALHAYREFFTAIAQDAHRPALFRCTTGKEPAVRSPSAKSFLGAWSTGRTEVWFERCPHGSASICGHSRTGTGRCGRAVRRGRNRYS
jgi:hypothetical protein